MSEQDGPAKAPTEAPPVLPETASLAEAAAHFLALATGINAGRYRLSDSAALQGEGIESPSDIVVCHCGCRAARLMVERPSELTATVLADLFTAAAALPSSCFFDFRGRLPEAGGDWAGYPSPVSQTVRRLVEAVRAALATLPDMGRGLAAALPADVLEARVQWMEPLPLGADEFVRVTRSASEILGQPRT
jgi:hypothetical protein